MFPPPDLSKIQEMHRRQTFSGCYHEEERTIVTKVKTKVKNAFEAVDNTNKATASALRPPSHTSEEKKAINAVNERLAK